MIISDHKSSDSTIGRQTQRVEREKRTPAQSRNRWLLIGDLFVMIVSITLLSACAPAVTPAAPGPTELIPTKTAVTEAPQTPGLPADNRALGPATAPVTIVEYGDFGCTTCRAWHNAGILNQIRNKYGDKVRFMWRDFPVITPQSPKAAEAGHCAADQGKFWEYHDVLYARQPILDVDSLKSYAAQMGLDAVKFNQCLDSGPHQAEVNRDWQDAIARGFRGTPSFLINDKPLAGPPSFEMLQKLIDPILARNG